MAIELKMSYQLPSPHLRLSINRIHQYPSPEGDGRMLSAVTEKLLGVRGKITT